MKVDAHVRITEAHGAVRYVPATITFNHEGAPCAVDMSVRCEPEDVISVGAAHFAAESVESVESVEPEQDRWRVRLVRRDSGGPIPARPYETGG